MKILVSCYACSPFKGSEPGMGWNFVKELSRRNELHIIVESKFRDDIDRYFGLNPEEHIGKHFYFIPRERHKILRRIWPPSYYWFYKRWQKKAFELASSLDRQLDFDIVHQLNMVGYREPGYLFRLGKPLVWGPIGGFNLTPWKMLPSMGLNGCLFYLSRNLMNLWQMHTSRRVRLMMRYSSVLVAATVNEAASIKRLYGRESVIIPEVGFSGVSGVMPLSINSNRLKLCWCGQFTHGKSLNLLLEACLCVSHPIELHIIGNGECEAKWKNIARRHIGLDITWYGWVTRQRSMEIMRSCQLFCITSLSDLTSTVLLEALSYGLPVVALDHCGFSNVITQECGIKVPIHSHQQVVRDLARAIDHIAEDSSMRLRMSNAAFLRAKEYGWEEKGIKVQKIYEEIVDR